MTIRVDTMRRIDHLIGVPLCLLLTPLVFLYDKIRNLFFVAPAQPKKILFIELSEMGSAIIVDPAMRETIKRGAEIFFLIFKNNAASLSLLQTVPEERILTIDASGLFTLIKSTLSVLFKIHRLNIDTVIDLELFSRFTALLTGCSGASRRVGYYIFHGEGLWRGKLLTHEVHYNPHLHISRNFMALVHAAFANESEIPFSKVAFSDDLFKLAQAKVSLEQLETVTRKLEQLAQAAGINHLGINHPNQQIILVNPNASDLLPQRRWAPERFSELITKLASRWPEALIYITGSKDELAYAEKVKEMALTTRVINFAGQVSFSELPALYTLSDVMVTNDSGPGHFSAVTPLPTVVLFGPETPALYGSLGNSIPIFAGLACSPCVSAGNHRKTPCSNNVCMQAISVEQVLSAIEKQLSKQQITDHPSKV
ncbi:MAG: glycosyltransferase family 9 protein [Betaproteobacteria bacterium]